MFNLKLFISNYKTIKGETSDWFLALKLSLKVFFNIK